ncbi:MAG: diaminopimelate decarboxylase [Candidatus Binatia bacterium]
MTLATTLIERHFRVDHGALRVGGILIQELTEYYGTPLFVYDQKIIEKKLTQLRAILPRGFSISYSVKANPCREILSYFLAQGCGLEIASGGEYYRARHAGCPPEHIIFAGPGKTDAELELVLTQGIGEIHVESLREICRIREICQALGKQGRIAIRVNPTGEVQGGAMRMGGKPAPFGIDEECLSEVVDLVVAERSLTFCGIHLFTGTQILDAVTLLSQYRKGIAIARWVAERCQQPLRTVDFGGGLGIPYFANEQELDLSVLQRGLNELMAEVRCVPLISTAQFVLEPGRYLVGEAGIYVTRVVDVKVSRGKKFVILDGGMNHHLAASGNLGQVIKRNFPIAILNRLTEAAKEKVDVVGPLCTPLDTLARDVVLPSPEIGDVIGILQSGAYGVTASPVGFLSHPLPAEVWVENGKATEIRPRGNYTEFA